MSNLSWKRQSAGSPPSGAAGSKEAVYRIEPGKTSVEAFGPLFQAAVETLTGERVG